MRSLGKLLTLAVMGMVGLLLAGVSPLPGAEAAIPASLCDCWTGTRLQTSPCQCSCPPPLMQPFCAFTSTQTDAVKIILATNTSKVTPAPVAAASGSGTTDTDARGGFSASILTEALQTRYGDFVNIQYARPVEEPTDFTRHHSTVICLMYSMNASTASEFLIDAANDAAWVTALGVTDANVFYADPAIGEDLQGQKLFEVPEANYGPIAVHLWDIIWILLLICPIMCCCCLECCCCFSNTEKKAEEINKYAAPGPEGDNNNDPYSSVVPVAAIAVAAAEPVAEQAPKPKQRVRAASTRPASVRITRIADANSPSPPNGRAKRPGRGRGVNGDYTVTDLDYDKESGLWWSNSEFLFFNKETRMWYDPETNLWFDAEENKWFEYNN